MTRPGRILVVDDHEFWRELLRETLTEGGFFVDCAASKAAALGMLTNNFYHLLIVDIRLDDVDEDNREGFELLAALDEDGLAAGVKIVVLSAYGTMDLMREAFTRFRVVDFAQKDAFIYDDFLEQVNYLFQSEINVNLSLDISWNNGAEPERLVANLLIEDRRIKPGTQEHTLVIAELDDLLCRLFYSANKLMVNPLGLGQSGAAVLRAQPFYLDDGPARSVVVKFGDRKSIEGEYRNFDDYVGRYIGAGRSTAISSQGLRSTTRLGGIVYSFLGTDADKLESFESFYEHSAVKEINPVISRLFQQTCFRWYDNRGNIGPLNLTEDYKKLLGFTAEKLEDGLARLVKSVQGSKKLKFSLLNNKDRSFTNPILELRDRKFIMPAYVTTMHGDFNETNILVDDNGYSWLIDFGRTGKGHIMRDVAELDSVVRLKLLKDHEATLDERLQLEEILCGIRHFKELDSLESSFTTDNDAVAKAFAVVLHLRRTAGTFASRESNDDMSEYYAALLYNAVNILRFNLVPPIQRLHGLLSASLLTDRLMQDFKLIRAPRPLTYS
jgi:CheY-like chemotaxis protein